MYITLCKADLHDVQLVIIKLFTKVNFINYYTFHKVNIKRINYELSFSIVKYIKIYE